MAELAARGRSASYPVAFAATRALTWSDFVRGVSAWKARCQELEVRRVALYLPDTWQFTLALFGAWQAGLEVWLPSNALPATCDALGAHVEAFLGDFPAEPGRRSVAAPRPTASAWLGRTPQPAGQPALRVFTSGTTGEPEAHAKSFDQLSAEVACLEDTFGQALGSCAVLSTVSHQHIYGLLFKVLWPLCAGRAFLAPTLFYPEEILAAPRRFTSSALVSSPAHLRRLPAALNWRDVERCWRAVFSSGGPLAWPAAAQCRELLGVAPIEVYGSSETGGIGWRQRSSDDVPFVAFEDVALAREPDLRTLRVRSPKLPSTDWFTTADEVALHEDGSFTLLGRADRIVKIEEKRIALGAVEKALRSSDLVTDALVLVLPTERTSLGAVLVLSPKGAELDARGLRERLRNSVATQVERVAVPARFRIVSVLPTNSSGKTPLAELLKLFERDA